MGINGKHIMLAIVLFWLAWGYSEYLDYVRAKRFESEVQAFMSRGGRNTNEMGYSLCLRVQHLEREHHTTTPDESCAKLYDVHKTRQAAKNEH